MNIFFPLIAFLKLDFSSFWRNKAWLSIGVITLFLPFLQSSWAADEYNWSSGLYRADPDRSPFQIPKSNDSRSLYEQERSDRSNQWWDYERLPEPSREPRFSPRDWPSERNYRPPSERSHRPWGEIPQWEEYDTNRSDATRYRDERLTYDTLPRRLREPPPNRSYRRGELYERDRYLSPDRDPYWDGPYQKEEYRSRYDRYQDYPERFYRRSPSSNYDVDPWWRSQDEYRQDSWDPWQRERYAPP